MRGYRFWSPTELCLLGISGTVPPLPLLAYTPMAPSAHCWTRDRRPFMSPVESPALFVKLHRLAASGYCPSALTGDWPQQPTNNCGHRTSPADHFSSHLLFSRQPADDFCHRPLIILVIARLYHNAKTPSSIVLSDPFTHLLGARRDRPLTSSYLQACPHYVCHLLSSPAVVSVACLL